MALQYLTTEQGKQIAVVLDMAAYQELLAAAGRDPELLTDLSREELQALADSKLAPEMQSRLGDLQSLQREGRMTNDDEEQWEQLLAQIDQLNILKARARLTLKELSQQ
jgi:hypothetical protein